jgi:hypothetical protein
VLARLVIVPVSNFLAMRRGFLLEAKWRGLKLPAARAVEHEA